MAPIVCPAVHAVMRIAVMLDMHAILMDIAILMWCKFSQIVTWEGAFLTDMSLADIHIAIPPLGAQPLARFLIYTVRCIQHRNTRALRGQLRQQLYGQMSRPRPCG